MNEFISGLIYVGRLGVILATVISYAENHSILWAMVHGCLSWVFVIYAAITYP